MSKAGEYVYGTDGHEGYWLTGEEIVRYRDCRHYSDHEWIIVTDVTHVCHFWHGEPTKVEPNGFCAWGERA